MAEAERTGPGSTRTREAMARMQETIEAVTKVSRALDPLYLTNPTQMIRAPG